MDWEFYSSDEYVLLDLIYYYNYENPSSPLPDTDTYIGDYYSYFDGNDFDIPD